MNAKISVFVIYIEAIIYLLLYSLHDCTFNHKYDIWNCGSPTKIKNLGRFGLKIAMCPIFMKFGTQNKLNMLIINISIGIDELDPKLQICKIWSQN